MKKILLSFFIGVMLIACNQKTVSVREVWTKEQANEWYKQWGWLRGLYLCAEEMETKHFIFKIMMYLVVVLFALQPEDYNSFSENEPPFLCIEQNEHHSPEEFNDEAVISRTLSLNRARKLCAETTTTYTFSTENTNLYQYSDGSQPYNLRSVYSPERSLLCIYRL